MHHIKAEYLLFHIVYVTQLFLYDIQLILLTLSYIRTCIYVRNPKTVATPVRLYTYTDFAIEIWGEFWKITIVGPSSMHRLAWNTTANYMDFLP